MPDRGTHHIVPDDLQCIQVKKLAPNLTSHVQPLDAGIIANFKRIYSREFLAQAICCNDDSCNPKDLYKIDLLAWDKIWPETIFNCWSKTEILPPSLQAQSKLSDQDKEVKQTLKEVADELNCCCKVSVEYDADWVGNPQASNDEVWEESVARPSKGVFDHIQTIHRDYTILPCLTRPRYICSVPRVCIISDLLRL